MRNLFIVVIFILVGLGFQCQTLFAQTADDFFHQAANLYINGKFTAAKGVIQSGLERYPTDPKLQALASKIPEPEPQEQDQQNQDKNQSEQEKEQQQQEQNFEEQQNQDQQQEEQQQQQAGEQKEISKEDAERILNALQNEEQDLLKQQRPKRRGRPFRGKDW